MSKFKIGDRILRVVSGSRFVPYKITSIKNDKYIVSNSNGVRNLHLGKTEAVDKQFELEEIVNSPLYKIMEEK